MLVYAFRRTHARSRRATSRSLAPASARAASALTASALALLALATVARPSQPATAAPTVDHAARDVDRTIVHATDAARTAVRAANADGGWQPMPPPTDADLHSIALAPAPAGGMAGWIVGAGGTILALEERAEGPAWVPVSSPTTATLTAVALADDGRAVAGGEQGVFLELVGGSWTVVTGPEPGTRIAGVAVGEDGVFAATGGQTGSYPNQRFFGTLWERIGRAAWRPVVALDRESFSDMANAPSGRIVVAVGGSATPGHEGWVRWTRQDGAWDGTSGFAIGSRPMESVAVTDQPVLSVWMAGASRFVHDGREEYRVPEGLYAGLAPLGPGDGWLAEDDGQLLRFHGGAFTAHEPLAEPARLHDMAMLGADVGFVVGDGGLILRRAGSDQAGSTLWLPASLAGAPFPARSAASRSRDASQSISVVP